MHTLNRQQLKIEIKNPFILSLELDNVDYLCYSAPAIW